jgi:hypothetical protein
MRTAEIFLLVALALSFGSVPLYLALKRPFDHS